MNHREQHEKPKTKKKGGSGKIVHSYTGLAITPHPLPSVPRHPSYSASMAPQWLSLKLDVPADMATDDSEPSEVIKSVLELMEVGDYAPLLDRQDLSSDDWRKVVHECASSSRMAEVGAYTTRTGHRDPIHNCLGRLPTRSPIPYNNQGLASAGD